MTLITPVPYVLNSTNVPVQIVDPEYNLSSTYNTGDRVYYPPMHTIYKATQNVPANHPPVRYPEYWEIVEVVNAYKMFDQYLNTQTVHNGIIEIDISGGDAGELDLLIDSIYLGNLYATSVSITAFDGNDNQLDQVTYNLMGEDCNDWLDYFSMSWVSKTKTDVLYISNSVVPPMRYHITITPINDTAKVGITLIGHKFTYGAVQYDAKTRVIDYSNVTTNEAGYTQLEKGYSTTLVDIDVVLPTRLANQLKETLKKNRGLPILLTVGDVELLRVYGILEDNEIILSSPVWSTSNIIVKGLI